MQYDYLAEFVTVAREQSLSKAARKLSVSQSVLSRHMVALEADMDTKLLVRSTHGVTLTKDGRYVLNKAADFVEAVNGIYQHLGKNSSGGRVVTIYGILVELPAAMAAFSKAFKEVSIENAGIDSRFLPTGSVPAPGEALRNGTIDILLTMPADEDLGLFAKGFNVIEIYREPLVAVLDASHPLAKKEHLTLEDLRGQTIVRGEGRFFCADLAWKETERLCSTVGFLPSSRSISFEGLADWYVMELGTDICVAGQCAPVIPFFRESGMACLPILDQYFSALAVYKDNDPLVDRVVNRVIAILESSSTSRGTADTSRP